MSNYVIELGKLLLDCPLPSGSVVTAVVEHDYWCAYLRGGECSCSPVIRIVRNYCTKPVTDTVTVTD